MKQSDHAVRRPIVGLFGLAVVLVLMWLAGIANATEVADGRASTAQMLSVAPSINAQSPDAALYITIIRRVHDGDDYYTASAAVLKARNDWSPNDVDTSHPLSHRLPTMYVLLSALPATGLSYIIATLILGTAAVIGSFLLTSRLVVTPVALSSSALCAVYYANMANSVSQLGTEVWAGALGLLAAGLLIRAVASEDHARHAMGYAAAAALAATMVRELAIAFVIVGLLVTLADPTMRRERAWTAWLIALALSLAAFASHAFAVAALPATASSATTVATQWFDPTGAGLQAVVARASWYFALPETWVWAILLASVVGGIVATRGLPARVRTLLVVLTVGGITALALLHPPGRGFEGNVPGYWGDLLIPLFATCAPLTLAL